MCDNEDRNKTYWEKYDEEMTLRRSRIEQIIPEVFSPGFEFPQQDSDEDFTITANNLISFGDLKDAGNANPQNTEVAGTIIGFVCTVRKFFPGSYKVTILKLFEYPDKTFGESDPIVIFHHEKVDPKQIGLQVIRLCQDYCDYHQGMFNYINRYDWCHWRNWGAWTENEQKLIIKGTPPEDENKESKEEEGNPFYNEEIDNFKPEKANTIFFTQSENAEQLEESLKLARYKQSEIIPELFSIHSENGTISLGVDYGALCDSEYLYAKVFQDAATEEYFALAVNGSLGVLDSNGGLPPFKPESISEVYQQYGFSTVSETSLKFDMANFML